MLALNSEVNVGYSALKSIGERKYLVIIQKEVSV